MSDYDKLMEIAAKDCECVENELGERCDVCEASGCLNQCAEDMAYTLKIIKSSSEQPIKSSQNAL